MTDKDYYLNRYGLKVSRIPPTITEKTLESIFMKYGNCGVKLRTGAVENYAHVNYHHESQAQKAARELDSTSLAGTEISVKLQTERGAPAGNTYAVKITKISKAVTEAAIQAYFSLRGTRCVHRTNLINVEGAPFNYAYVNYSMYAGALRAETELNGTLMNGNKITVKAQPIGSSARERRQSTTENTVKITNISKSVTDEMIESYFTFMGTIQVESVKLINVAEGPFNYAYVNYTSTEDAQRAERELNGVQIEGYNIVVKIHAATTPTSPLTTSPLSKFPRHTESLPLLSHPPLPPQSCTVKVTIHDDILSANDLETFFSRYGTLKDKPVIRGSQPKYAYVNFDGSTARQAQSLDVQRINGCRVTVRLANTKFRSSKPAQLDSRQIACKPLTLRLLRTEEYSRKLEDIASDCHVSIKEMKKGNGVSILGLEGNIDRALSSIQSLFESISGDLQEKLVTLPSFYVPLFQDHSTVTLVAQVETKHCVEVLMMDTAGLAQDVNAFSQFVTREFSSQVSPQVGCLTKYLQAEAPTCQPQERQWLWQDDLGGYTPYSPTVCKAINIKLAVSPKCILQCSLSTPKGKTSYNIDFGAMRQTNMKTNFVRRIKCETKAPQTSSLPSKHYHMTLRFRGPIDNLEPAAKEFEEELKKSKELKSEQYDQLPSTTDDQWRSSLKETASHYFVSAKLVGATSIELRGTQEHLKSALLRVKEKALSHQHSLVQKSAKDLANLMSTTLPSQFPLPTEWGHQKEEMALKPLKQTSSEWKKVSDLVKKTLTSAKLLSVQRIQNKWLWQRYCFSKQRMSDKNKGVVNEKELFHGTRSTPPEKIYKSEKGFDFRYSDDGLWGNGTYFAVNANYSSKYAFSSALGKQMILAKVLTGETVRCAPDTTLKKPPIKTRGLTAIFSASKFEDELYDSVSGHTNGSDIFVVYDHEKAYPAYLIDYN